MPLRLLQIQIGHYVLLCVSLGQIPSSLKLDHLTLETTKLTLQPFNTSRPPSIPNHPEISIYPFSLDLEVWNFSGIWSLEFGISSPCLCVFAANPAHSHPFNSRIAR